MTGFQARAFAVALLAGQTAACATVSLAHESAEHNCAIVGQWIDPATGNATLRASLPSGSGWEGLAAVPTSPTGTSAPVVSERGLAGLRAFPNPARGASRVLFDVRRAGPVEARIVDVAGRVVRGFAPRPMQAGVHTITWDGRAADGRAVPAGVYFFEVRRGTEREVAKVTVVR